MFPHMSEANEYCSVHYAEYQVLNLHVPCDSSSPVSRRSGPHVGIAILLRELTELCISTTD